MDSDDDDDVDDDDDDADDDDADDYVTDDPAAASSIFHVWVPCQLCFDQKKLMQLPSLDFNSDRRENRTDKIIKPETHSSNTNNAGICRLCILFYPLLHQRMDLRKERIQCERKRQRKRI